MNLNKLRNILENTQVIQNEETYKQFAGLEYDNTVIEEISKLKVKGCKLFLRSFSEPRELFLSALENMAEDKTKKLENRLFMIRNKDLIDKRFKIDDNYVNWSNWRQYNIIEKDPKNRKKVFDCFIEKTKLIKPVIEKRFNDITDIYQYQGKMTPLQGYLESENISYDKLKDFIEKIANTTKNPFNEKIIEIANKILNRPPEYFDDFYYFRNIVFNNISAEFQKINPIQTVTRTLKELKIDINRITFDSEDRKNKYPSPICFFIDIPKDIRILYRKESPYFDFQGCYHESGHAMHATSIDPNLEYEKKYHIPMGITEIFSIFLERLTRNKIYLKKKIKITDENTLDKIVNFNNFMELFFVTFYSANSLTKMDFWMNKLSIEKTNKTYSRLIKKYTGINMPGEYWMLHHIMPESIMYVPSYLLATVRANELERKIEEKYGQQWWELEKAGNYLKNLMKDGSNTDIDAFSKLDPTVFLKEITST